MSLEAIGKSKHLHESDPNYSLPSGYSSRGTLKSEMKLPWALKSIYPKFTIQTFLDYGCGKNGLISLLKGCRDFSSIDFRSYDPAVAEYADKPTGSFDIVTCIDVLEHLEYHSIDNFLKDLKKYTKHFCFLLIDLQPAVAHLSNGRNAHTLLAPHDWWAAKVAQHFDTTLNFPINHKGGFMQKYIITASQNTQAMTAMMTFTHKLNIFNAIMSNPKA